MVREGFWEVGTGTAFLIGCDMQVKLETATRDGIHIANSRLKAGKWTKEGGQAWTG